jgi:hypothetical protein
MLQPSEHICLYLLPGKQRAQNCALGTFQTRNLWRDCPDRMPLHTYEAGSTGSSAADKLMATDGRVWMPL